MSSERFEMRIPTALLARLDEARGYEARASFIKRTLEQALGDGAPRSSSPGPADARPATPAPPRTSARAPAFNRATSLKR